MSTPRQERVNKRSRYLTRVLAMVDLVARIRGRKGSCGVGPRPGQNVQILLGSPSPRYWGLHTCDAGGVCPRCAVANLEVQRDELQSLMSDAQAVGGDVIMISLSVGFQPNTSLAQRWTVLADMLAKLGTRTRARNARDAVGKIGQVKVVHLLHGDQGWHAHLHLLYILDRRITRAEARALAAVETSVWEELAVERGCTAHPIAQRYRVVGRTAVDIELTARYFTKAREEITFGTKNPDDRVFACDLDHRRSRSPWQLMNDATFERDLLALVPLAEWVGVVLSTKFKRNHMPRKLMAELRAKAIELKTRGPRHGREESA